MVRVNMGTGFVWAAPLTFGETKVTRLPVREQAFKGTSE